MKIAFFTDDYLPYVHGVTRSIQNYKEALEELGHEVYIIAPAPRQKNFKDDDDHVIRLPSIQAYIFDKRPVSVLYPGIARRLDKYDFDIVHSHTQFYVNVVAGLVAKRKNIPLVTTLHTLFTELITDYPLAMTSGLIAATFGYPFVYRARPILPFSSRKEIRELPRMRMLEIMKKQGLKLIVSITNHADVRIAPSMHLYEKLAKNGANKPMKNLPNGVFTKDYQKDRQSKIFSVDENKKYIVCVSRVSGEKRQQVLIEMMPDLPENCELILIGDGPMLDKLQSLTQDLGVANRVHFLGLLGADDVAYVLQKSHIFAFASCIDNQPMVILEAISSGLPIVYCDDNLREGLKPENSCLTSGIEAKDFAKTINQLLENEAVLGEKSKASLDVAKSFDRLHLAQKLVDIYEELIEEKKS